jgi:hypothetical protein
LSRESVFYDKTAIYLRDINSHEKADPAFRTQSPKKAQRSSSSLSPRLENQQDIPAAEADKRCAPQSWSLSPVGSKEAEPVPSRLRQHDIDIKQLSQKIDSLQDRMLALENSIIEVRTDLRASSLGDVRIGQDMFIENFQAIFAAMKDARSANKAMEELRSENESLKQELRSIPAPAAAEIRQASLESPFSEAAKAPFLAAPAPVKRKRPYTRRKPLVLHKAATPAATDMNDADSSFTSQHDIDDPPTPVGLAALNQITAAMAQNYSNSQSQTLNDLADHESGSYTDDKLTNGNAILNHNLGDGADLPMVPPRKRRKSHEEVIGDCGVAGRRGREKGNQRNADGSLTPNSCPNQPFEEQRPIAEPMFLQKAEPAQPRAAQLKDGAAHFDMADVDDTVIDPALRSTSVTSRPPLPAPNVLWSIENPPEQRQARQSIQQEKTDSASQYDSIHEARIREYKARDALRKRKTRVISTEKKKMDGEDKFKQEEKIRARDRMVKELMEREEMLDNDGDL